MRRILVVAATFVFCVVAGYIAGVALGFIANSIAGGVQVQFPLAYKALLYNCYLYVPFLVLTLATASLKYIPGRGLPASLAYLAVVGGLFASGKYFARGMEIESLPGYALVLFVPAVIFISLGLLMSKRVKDNCARANH